MARKGTILAQGVATVLLLISLTTSAQGIVGRRTAGNVTFTRITGQLICMGCSLNEVREAQAGRSHLYELAYEGGKVVIDIQWSDEVDQKAWENLAGAFNQLQVRANEAVLQQLTAEKNVLKKFVMSGTLYKDRTLDIDRVTVSG